MFFLDKIEGEKK